MDTRWLPTRDCGGIKQCMPLLVATFRAVSGADVVQQSATARSSSPVYEADASRLAHTHAMILEELVTKIVGLSAPNDLSQLYTALKKEADDVLMRAPPASIGPAAAQLDSEQHALGKLFVL